MLKSDELIIDKEFEELLPVLTPDESENLEQSILKNGLLDPIKIWEEPKTGRFIIIDGHNRYRILKKNNISLNYWDYKIIYADELPTRDDVKRWMLEQQLGRRNLSDIEKYEIVQKFKSVFEQKAKQNQSLGGKGLSNLSKVNTRKQMANATGVSEGSYRKIDAVMQSDNEELKQKLRDKKISTDAAYKKLKKKELDQKPLTPEQEIDRLDKRIDSIEKTMKMLMDEKEKLLDQRISVIGKLDVKCPVEYKWVKSGTFFYFWKAQFYVKSDGKKNVLGEYLVYGEEYPSNYSMEQVPEKFRSDFRMVWKKAHDEVVQLEQESLDELLNNSDSVILTDKTILKKFYRVLANTYHPDNDKTGDPEMMQYVNELKNEWGI
jgi:ParB-like chromosome segregation protein Spo0J|nr:MAG TPA: chromosome partitioning protein [Caudoviricetes sp.]